MHLLKEPILVLQAVLISSESGPTYTTTSNEPSNKKVAPQRFCSTEKRSANVQLTELSSGQKDAVYNSLLELYRVKDLEFNSLKVISIQGSKVFKIIRLFTNR